jgi:hypothetical protein
LADRCGGFSLELKLPVHSPDPIPKCLTAKVEIIIAQFRVLCTGNFVFSPRKINAVIPPGGLGSGTS